MRAAWVAFATTGDCGRPRYDLGQRAPMRFDATCEAADDPQRGVRGLCEAVR